MPVPVPPAECVGQCAEYEREPAVRALDVSRGSLATECGVVGAPRRARHHGPERLRPPDMWQPRQLGLQQQHMAPQQPEQCCAQQRPEQLTMDVVACSRSAGLVLPESRYSWALDSRQISA